LQFPVVAISPCPNDTFAFFSIAANKVCPLEYLDIEQLNLSLLQDRFDIAKGSFAIMEKLRDTYEILPAGAAIGRGVGPVMVGKIFAGARIGLPGENTTAHRLFRFWQKQNTVDLQIVQMPFHEMLPAVIARRLDAAVLIHEGRFVYACHGIPLVVDLGAYWENETGSMIPLGCIYARKSLSPEIKATFVSELRKSISISRDAYAARSALYREKILPHMLSLAQENDAAVAEAHVDTYVTSDTFELSAEALKSVDIFSEKCLS